jgi:hypothetical protein
MKPINTILEAIRETEKVANYYLWRLGFHKVPEVKVINFDTQDEFNPTNDLKDGTDICVEIDGWILITPFKLETGNAIHYEISIVKVIPGVHYGSGHPDDVDVDIISIQTDKPLQTPSQAIKKAIHVYIDNVIEMASDNYWLEEMDQMDQIDQIDQQMESVKQVQREHETL